MVVYRLTTLFIISRTSNQTKTGSRRKRYQTANIVHSSSSDLPSRNHPWDRILIMDLDCKGFLSDNRFTRLRLPHLPIIIITPDFSYCLCHFLYLSASQLVWIRDYRALGKWPKPLGHNHRRILRDHRIYRRSGEPRRKSLVVGLSNLVRIVHINRRDLDVNLRLFL
jgi:hypothetical protein